MKKYTAVYLFIFLAFFGMNVSHAEESVDLRNTYAVVWEVETDDEELFKLTLAEQANSLIALWQKGIVENVYLDRDTFGRGDEANVMFFIKAKSEEEAKGVLDAMPFVKKDIAKYTLHHVGILWLKQF